MNLYETPILVDVEELAGFCGCATGGQDQAQPVAT